MYTDILWEYSLNVFVHMNTYEYGHLIEPQELVGRIKFIYGFSNLPEFPHTP